MSILFIAHYQLAVLKQYVSPVVCKPYAQTCAASLTIPPMQKCLCCSCICGAPLLAPVVQSPHHLVYTYAHTHTHLHTPTHTYTHIYTHMHTHTHLRTHLRTLSHTHTHTYTHISTRTHTHTHTHTHSHTLTHTPLLRTQLH